MDWPLLTKKKAAPAKRLQLHATYACARHLSAGITRTLLVPQMSTNVNICVKMSTSGTPLTSAASAVPLCDGCSAGRSCALCCPKPSLRGGTRAIIQWGQRS